MKYFLKGLFFLICFFSSINLSAAHLCDSFTTDCQAKIYFDPNDLEISENIICIHLKNSLIETSAIRTNQHGLYIFESDITNYSVEKKWKCPYCYHWSPIGQKCQNPECPTNKW